MDAQLRSDNVSLQFGYDDEGYDIVSELWQTLRRTAVEPGQSSHPDYLSFADECLLCARIMINEPSTSIDDQNELRSIWDPEDPLQDPPPPSLPVTPVVLRRPFSVTAGLVYLHASPANLPGGEANIGVITKPDVQRGGFAREAIQLVLRWAFEELKFHRVQAAILDTPSKDRALRLFIGTGFAHEGTKRRAVYQPEGEGMAGVWKDVTYLAMLDTEWVLKSTWIRTNRAPQPPVASVWDEMFARHAREREELVRWEEKHGRIRRTSSTETLRERARNAASDLAYLTDDASSVGASTPPSPRPNLVVTWEEEMSDDFGPEVPHGRWEQVVETSLAAQRHRRWMGSASASLDPSPHAPMLALPSIPSIMPSESFASPVTIPTPSTPGSTASFSGTPPPFSPSPSPVPSFAHSSWFDEDEDERNWLLREDPFVMPHEGYAHPGPGPGPSSLYARSRGSSVSSTADSWSDAQSSAGDSASSWDVISNASDHSPRGRA